MTRDYELIEAWAVALESGDYQQAQKKLRDNGGYCCLGVLCDVAAKTGKVDGEWTESEWGDRKVYSFAIRHDEDVTEREVQWLPVSIAYMVGMTSNGELRDVEGHSRSEDWVLRDWVLHPGDGYISFGALSSFNDDWMEKDEIFPAVARALREQVLSRRESS
jgi:hypothetical protein